MCRCTRCGEELTTPKYHNGYPYGYSCYEIVAGVKSKDKRKYVQVELLAPLPDSPRFELIVQYQGKKYNLGIAYRSVDTGKPHNPLCFFASDNNIYMVTHDAKGKAIWKSIP